MQARAQSFKESQELSQQRDKKIRELRVRLLLEATSSYLHEIKRFGRNKSLRSSRFIVGKSFVENIAQSESPDIKISELMINSSCQSDDKEIFEPRNRHICDSHRITNNDMHACCGLSLLEITDLEGLEKSSSSESLEEQESNDSSQIIIERLTDNQTDEESVKKQNNS